MAYIGNSLNTVTRIEYNFTAEDGQKVIKGIDENGAALAFDVNAYEVFLNGVLQGTDNFSGNGSQITFNEPLVVGDKIVIRAFQNFQYVNESSAMDRNVYDPNNVNEDAFNLDNMRSGATNISYTVSRDESIDQTFTNINERIDNLDLNVDLSPYAKTADVDTKLETKADKTYVDDALEDYISIDRIGDPVGSSIVGTLQRFTGGEAAGLNIASTSGSTSAELQLTISSVGKVGIMQLGVVNADTMAIDGLFQISARAGSVSFTTIFGSISHNYTMEQDGNFSISGEPSQPNHAATVKFVQDTVTSTKNQIDQDIVTTLEDYVTDAELTNALGEYAKTSNVSSTLNNFYVKIVDLDTTLEDYVTNTNLTTTLGDYVTTQTMNNQLENKANNSRFKISTDDPSGGVDGDIWFKVV